MEPTKPKSNDGSQSTRPAVGPTDIDTHDVVDWDFRAEVRELRPAGVVDAEVVRVGRAKPIPLGDPRARVAE